MGRGHQDSDPMPPFARLQKFSKEKRKKSVNWEGNSIIKNRPREEIGIHGLGPWRMLRPTQNPSL